MTITKILEGTLIAGQSTITFTDTDIPNSIIRVFPADSELIYESITVSSNTLSIVYPVQGVNKAIAVELTKAGLSIIDNTTSTDTAAALSANQGKLLKDSLDTVSGDLADLTLVVNNLDIPDNITDLDDVNVTSIQDGQILAWDEDTSKFVNVNQSSGSSDDYSTTEKVVGTWVDGSTLYRKTINFGALPNATDKTVAHGISNLGYVCKADAVGYNTTSGLRIPFPMTNSAYLNQQVSWWINDTNIVFRTAVDYSLTNVCYVTLVYTKTS